MSEEFDMDLEHPSAASAEDDAGKKKSGFIPSIVIKILKWTAIILVGIVFIVTIVVVTIRIMNPVSSAPNFFYDTEVLQNTLPTLQWYDIGGEIRCRTADVDRRVMVLVSVSAGFNPKSKVLYQELVDQTPRLRNEIRLFFGEKYERELIPRNERRVKEELRRRLNIMLSSSERISDIIFTDINVVEF